MNRTAKELADELDARNRLRDRGYTWNKCQYCKGIGMTVYGECFPCRGSGGHWRSPMAWATKIR